MASSRSTPYGEHEFVEPIPKEFICPVCYEVFATPFLTSCCGNHFCEACVRRTKTNKDQCPLCQTKPIAGIIDKHFQRRINERNVFCIRKAEGCAWIGPFCEVDKHCNETTGSCNYALVPCPFSCQEKVTKLSLDRHVNEECLLRPYACMYKCGYVSTYISVSTSHHPKCPDCLLPCPNSCSDELIKRSHLEQHLLNCPCATVACCYSEIGCEVRLKVSAMQKHIETNLIQHQLMMCASLSELKKDTEELKHAAKRPNHWINGYKLLAEETMSTNWNSYLLSLAVIASNTPLPVSPVIFKIPNYNDKMESGFYSAPLYSYDAGYKMQLCIYPSGIRKGLGTHMSIIVCLIKGENDYRLSWPFCGSVNVTILNQLNNFGHHENEIRSPSYAVLASDPSASNYFGLEKFMSHSHLKIIKEDCQYLVSNTLYVKIVVHVTAREEEHAL
ncbi:TNF receptor-associated factor 4-like [Dysidea avara]|uniref:TNF receptor-associated factor 4-like n=1 Tax=Dysidea avara TaxID=196820 RepID=UPI00332119E6